MANMTRVDVTRTWQKVSEGDCVLQAFSGSGEFMMFIGATVTANTYFKMQLVDVTNLSFKTPVWLKLASNSSSVTESIIVVK